jgi:ubiquinone/menaquinone biosynthesis C-methylase UbiE
MQSQKSVEPWGWMWTERPATGTTRTFHRNLFKRWGIWFDSLDGKDVADVCSGNGRNVWGLNRLTKAKNIISVELADASIEYQKNKFKDVSKIKVIHADATEVKFQADFIYLCEAIQHTANPELVLKNIYGNLRDNGELVVTFYMKTPATIAIEPIRLITKNLPRQLLWWISPCLAPLFMARHQGRELGFQNARHIAYDWFACHEYQRYFTEPEVLNIFSGIGIEEANIIQMGKGLYKVRKGPVAKVDDTVYTFGKED